jgi:hypothetical protein
MNGQSWNTVWYGYRLYNSYIQLIPNLLNYETIFNSLYELYLLGDNYSVATTFEFFLRNATENVRLFSCPEYLVEKDIQGEATYRRPNIAEFSNIAEKNLRNFTIFS